jgi:gluconokinase
MSLSPSFFPPFRSTTAKVLAKELNYEFLDGDDFHSVTNKQLMSKGIGLNDEQRLPWLQTIHTSLSTWKQHELNGIMACSSLKQKYRRLLNSNINYSVQSQTETVINLGILFIILNCDKSLIEERLSKRTDHEIIKDSRILASQFEALELPDPSNSIWHDENGSYLCKEPVDPRLMGDQQNDFYFVFVLKVNRNSSVHNIVDCIKQFLSSTFSKLNS